MSNKKDWKDATLFGAGEDVTEMDKLPSSVRKVGREFISQRNHKLIIVQEGERSKWEEGASIVKLSLMTGAVVFNDDNRILQTIVVIEEQSELFIKLYA